MLKYPQHTISLINVSSQSDKVSYLHFLLLSASLNYKLCIIHDVLTMVNINIKVDGISWQIPHDFDFLTGLLGPSENCPFQDFLLLPPRAFPISLLLILFLFFLPPADVLPYFCPFVRPLVPYSVSPLSPAHIFISNSHSCHNFLFHPFLLLHSSAPLHMPPFPITPPLDTDGHFEGQWFLTDFPSDSTPQPFLFLIPFILFTSPYKFISFHYFWSNFSSIPTYSL
jgi:hypothetical protein